MKRLVRLICCAWAMQGLVAMCLTAGAAAVGPWSSPWLSPWLSSAHAQTLGGFEDLVVREQSPGGASFMQGLAAPVPGHVWLGANGANHGLGYEGSYFSGGYMLDIFDDPWEGSWIIDARGHISAERGNFFGNLGFLRNVYFDPMKSDVRVGLWYDIDDDAPGDWGHTLHQLSVSGEVLGDLFDFRANGYIPVGEQIYRRGNSEIPLGNFYSNRFLAQTGIDNALRGFDVMGGIRPGFAEAWRGSLELGGYYYRSNIVDPFGGFKARVTVSPSPMLSGVFEVNHDRVYKTTGFLGVSMHFGSGAFGQGGRSPSGRGLELPRRNDHIVRFYQEPIVAINPNTGRPFRVLHVDNTSTEADPNGTYERRFATLAEAEALSVEDDVIAVHRGDGTSRGYDTGITLKDRQFLVGGGGIGGGGPASLPTQQFGRVNVGAEGLYPILTNQVGPAVTLANNNEVGGIGIDDAFVGIFGTGITGTIGDSLLEAYIYNNLITNSFGDGTLITQSQGDFLFQGNLYAGNFGDGVEMRSNSGTVVFNGNNQFLGNGLGVNAGIHVRQEGGVGLGSSPFIAIVEDNTIEGNGVGVNSEADGAGSNLTTIVRDNRSISFNADGVRLSSFNAGLHNASVIDNDVIEQNGFFAEGVGVRLLTGGNVGGVAVLNALIARNTFTDNLGDVGAGVPVIAAPPQFTEFGGTSGVYGFVDGTSLMNVVVENNTFDNTLVPGLNAIQFTFGGNNAANMSTVLAQDNLMINQGGGSAYAATGNGRGTVLVQRETILGGTANNGFSAGGFGTGELTWTLRDSSVVGHSGAGVLLRVDDAGTLNANVVDVVSQFNLNGATVQGRGFGEMVAQIVRSDFSFNFTLSDPIPNDEGNGFQIINTDAADLDVRLWQNTITNNQQFDFIARNFPDPPNFGLFTPTLFLGLYGNVASQEYFLSNPFFPFPAPPPDFVNGDFFLQFDNFNTPSPASYLIFPEPGQEDTLPHIITIVPGPFPPTPF